MFPARAPGTGGGSWLCCSRAAVTVTSITGYVALSFTVNGLPPYPSAGWVAVLQPATGPDADVVQLLVQARTEGNQTRAAYDVVVCGPRPYTGDLLIGGSARLATILPDPVMPASLPPPRVQRIPDLIFNFGGVINLGPSSWCTSASSMSAPARPHPAASLPPSCPAAAIRGSSESRPGRCSKAGQAPGAGGTGRASQAWPLTGAFPGVAPGALGDFIAVSGLSGSWTRPVQEYAQVSADDVPVSWSVDSAMPAATGPYPLVWQSRTAPLSPIAQLTDSPSLALLQDWVVIFAVGFGIAGSMLASLLFEWLRPRPQQAAAGSRIQPSRTPVPAADQAQPAEAPGGPGRWLALIATIIVIGYARSRLTRRKSN